MASLEVRDVVIMDTVLSVQRFGIASMRKCCIERKIIVGRDLRSADME